MWGQWTGITAAPMPAFVAPLPTTAPPPPPTEPAPQPPHVVASTTLLPPTVAPTAVLPVDFNSAAAGNPYSQYTATQYAAMTPEQQYALQQHWQQWQAYQEEYAKWHAQYGEQYKREMEAAAASNPAYANYYQQQLPVPATVTVPAATATVATTVSKPVSQQPAKITGQPQLYNQPPPAVNLNQLPPSINLNQYNTSQAAPPIAATRTAQQPMEFTQPPPTFNATQPPPPITQENTATLGSNRNFCSNYEGENDNQGYQQNDANNRFSENSRQPQQNNNNNMNNDNRGGGPSRNNRGGSNMGFNDGRDNWNNNRGSGPPPQNFNNRNNEWNPGANNYGNVAPNDGNNNNGFQGPPPNWNNSNNSNNNNNWGNSGSNDGPYQNRERAVNRPNNDNFQNRERGSNWNKNNNGGKSWGNNNNNNNFNRQNDNFNGRNNGNRGNANNDNNNRSRSSGPNNNNWDNNNGPMGRPGNNSNNNNWNQRGGNNWGGGVNAQQQRNFGHNNTPNNNPRGGGADNNQRQPDLDEESFDRQFHQWEEQFEQWKRANANHPDRAMYRRYEQEFEKQRRRIIERREQMRRRKIQIGLSPTQLKNAPPPIASNELCNQDESNTQSSNDQETLQHQQEQEQEQSQQHLSNENLTESEKHKEVEKSEEMNPDNPEMERTQLQHQQQQPKQHFQDIAASNTSTPLGGKRKSRFSAMPSKILASDDTTTPNVAKATAVINLDEDDDNKSDAENSSPKITELFRKSDGIPGLDLVESDNEKTQTLKEGNGANRQQAATKEESVGTSSAQNNKSATLPDITKSLNDPEFMKKISEAVAKAQGKDCSDNVEKKQQQSTSNENMRLDDDGRPLSFAEWQRRKGAIKSQHHSNVNVERDSTNSNDSNAVRDRVIDLCDRRSNVDQDEDNNDDDYDEDCSQNEDNDGPVDSGFNRFGVQLDSRDCNYASDNFEPPEPNQFGVNFRGFNGRNFGPNGPGGPNLGGGGGPINFGRNFGPGNWGPHGPGNFGPNGPGNWGPNMPGNWGPHGPGNWRPNGPNSNFGPNFGPGNNFGPNFRQNIPNFGPNGRNFGPNFGPNGPGRNFGRNSPFNRRNFGGGNNRSNFNMDFNGPNGPNFGGGGGSGSGSIGSGDDYNNSNDNSNDASNENKSMQNTNNPFRRQDGPRAPVFGDDTKANRNDTSNKMDDESWLKGPGGGGIGDYTNNDYSGGGGGAYFRHMQVIDYTENAKAPKVIDYGHKPAEVFKPVQTIEYGHASMPQQQQQEPQHQHQHQSQQESQKILTRQQRINQKKKQRRKIKKTTLTNTNNTYNNNNLNNNNDQNTANNETLQENNAQNQQSNATARMHNQMTRNANGNDDDNKKPSNICENKENIMKSNLEEVSDTENLPDSVVDMDLDNGSPAPPPPPTLSSGGHNFLTANYHQTTNSGAPISIFPSTAVANENIPQMSAKHVQMSFPTVENQNTITIDEILFKPGRYSRPKKICIILRGPPGSGKSHVAKLIKEKEKEMDGSNPRILSIDDYFLIENDYEEKCAQTGRKITKKEISYEYDKKMEERYMQYLIKSFKKTITDNLYDFIVVDCNNNSLRSLNEFYCHSKDSGYMPYIIDLFSDLDTCLSRNIHKRATSDIKEIINNWKLTPFHYIKLDVSTLLDNVVEMEDAENVAVDEPEVIDITDNNSVCSVSQSEMNVTDTDANKEEDDDSNDEDSANCGFLKSKWETDNTTEKMARLDGTSKLGIKRKPTMEEYLQMDDWQPPTVSTANNGKKRGIRKMLKIGTRFIEGVYDNEIRMGSKLYHRLSVRWADIEEKRKQEKMRAVGFVVGQTDWKRMMDPNAAKRALNKMKYIEPNKKKR